MCEGKYKQDVIKTAIKLKQNKIKNCRNFDALQLEGRKAEHRSFCALIKLIMLLMAVCKLFVVVVVAGA